MNPDKTRQNRSNNGWGDRPTPQARHLTGECTAPHDLCADCFQPKTNPGGRCPECHAKLRAKMREKGLLP